jgi:hypothetical protein
MAGIESDVLTTFLDQLKDSGEAPEGLVDQLRVALSQVKLPKADELAVLYADCSGDPSA